MSGNWDEPQGNHPKNMTPPPTNIPTPRTDDEVHDLKWNHGASDTFVFADFARALERENIALAKENEELKRLTLTPNEYLQQIIALRAEVEKAWNEGFLSGRDRKSFGFDVWHSSRAKQVAEGKIPLDVAK